MSEWSIFRKVLLPNALPGIISGGVLAFARGLGEFGATAMIAGNIAGKTRTLPLAVYSSVVSGEMGEAGYYVAIVVALCLVMVVGLNWYLYLCKKRQGN
jgi:molybdate transport system permease protein